MFDFSDFPDVRNFPIWRYLDVKQDGIWYEVRLKFLAGTVLNPVLKDDDPRRYVGRGLSKKEAFVHLAGVLNNWALTLSYEVRQQLPPEFLGTMLLAPVRSSSIFTFNPGTATGASGTVTFSDATTVVNKITITYRLLGWYCQGKAHAVMSSGGLKGIACTGKAHRQEGVSPLGRPTRLPKCKKCVRFLQSLRLPVGQKAYRSVAQLARANDS